MSVRIQLQHSMFCDLEREIASAGAIKVTGFRYKSGVEALRVISDRAVLIVLPFKGQQIWRAIFDGRDITMGSMFDEPRATQTYLETYGAFLIHCGMSAMGVPGDGDAHPLHGELPNAPMDDAWITIDENSGMIDIASSYQYTIAFTTNYRAIPRIRLETGESKISVTLEVENLRKTPIELMYLAHANFKPADQADLIYSAKYEPNTVRVRQSIPSHISPPPGYAEFINALAQDPTKHHHFDPGLAFDPEVVFQIDALEDKDGLFHAMQRHKDGHADFIAFKPKQAPVAMRWICRTPDQQGLGIAFPATAGVEGYTIEKSKGRVLNIAGGDTWRIEMSMGTLTPSQSDAMAAHIDQVAGRS